MIKYIGSKRALLTQIATAVREILLNAIEHGGRIDPSQHVEVAYLRARHMVICRVKDPGQGFSLEEMRHTAMANPPEDPIRHIAHREVASVHNGEVSWLRTIGTAAARDHGMVDFVFIDGDHSEQGLLADWQAWSPLVESGGIVALHDSRSTPQRPIDDAGSVKVTNDVILRDERFSVVDTVDSLTVLQRRA